ncbi:hypothetical protein ACFQ3P_25790 [Paraburkholderia sabiae]|uniref:Uncharacterized protein n=1 Tax=Paraburkholderia sabiae TaxID=273251 RepID=A0ABU9QLW4_9BURK|nr:hypothetical protein [Paraburkholderia sabiae]WJZ77326.1 hypothetical protein QEN71_35225 [Paraburkholderia sabiae]
MIQIQKILPTCFLFAVLVSFTTIASASAESDPEPPALETTIHTFTRCPVSGATGPTIGALPVFLVPILSAVISRGVDVTVDKAAKLVQDAASPKDFVLTPPAPITAPFYKITSSGDVQISQQINCVVVVRGRIGFSVIDPLANSLAGAPPLLRGIMTRFSASEPNGPHPARTAVAGKPTYHLIEPPEYYAEFALVTSDSGDKIALRPQVLYVGDFQSKDGLFGPSKRTYTTVINFSEVGSALPFLSAEFKYNNVARNESKLQCDGISSKLTCESAILGPERGWASTLARTGEITAAQQGRQKMASTLALAATPAPPKRPSFADEVPDARTSLIAYCNAISAQNKEKSSPQKFSSDACPVSITQTKRDYEYALVLAQYQIEKSKANDFRQKKCPGTAPFDNTAVVQCMNKLPELQEMDIGNFQISASISETRPGNKVAEFFVPVIDEVSPGIKTAIKEQIDPAERRRAKEAEEEKARTDASASRDAKVALKEAEIRVQIAQNDYEQALSNVEKNFSDSSAKNTLLEKKIALIQQQVAANNAARTVGQAVPYPDAE